LAELLNDKEVNWGTVVELGKPGPDGRMVLDEGSGMLISSKEPVKVDWDDAVEDTCEDEKWADGTSRYMVRVAKVEQERPKPGKVLFLVTRNIDAPMFHNRPKHILVWTTERELAKNRCRSFLGGNPDHYTVTPLTNPGEETWIIGRVS
jgi:hypothetical protein